MAMPSRDILLYTSIAILALTAGVFTAQFLEKGDSDKPSAKLTKPAGVPERRIDFTLSDLEGKQRSLSEWDGKVILLNFWATWCPPCRKEMPDFVEMREQLEGQPFEIIGVAIDQADAVQDFIDTLGAEYPILLAEIDGLQIMRAYGNQLTTLPYTVIIDRDGNVVKAFRTEVNKQQLLEIIEPLLEGGG